MGRKSTLIKHGIIEISESSWMGLESTLIRHEIIIHKTQYQNNLVKSEKEVDTVQ